MRAISKRRSTLARTRPLPQAGEGISFPALDLENMAADTAAFIASDRAGAMTGTVANLSAGAITD